ncbi:putative bifunctional diguanylate cyclase/phosphodiesterase [Caenimonas terrae]|uniref:Bifunctional diguanylate cyclase/phosphodiesterase n=1 Tax=Caenimonas terrae TaxID=696074 RepID=A0ABW0NH96_9BURK
MELMAHIAPPLPPDEADRLVALEELAILDTEPEKEFDRLVQLATTICQAPIGAIAFIDSQRQWFKARVGVDVTATPRDLAFCAYTIAEPEHMLEVQDAETDPRFVTNLFGPDFPPVRFYAGYPLQTREGSAVGTLFVMDTVPRTLTATQREALAKLAHTVSTQLTMRRELRVATQSDRLTGLPNWFHFESQFERSKAAHSVLVLVRLKTVGQITSAHGFRTADAMIKQTALRLRSCLREDAFVGRIKRGLFVMYFPGLDPAEFRKSVAGTLSACLCEPYNIESLALVCPVHIGVAVHPEDGAKLDDLVTAADSALQVAIERDEPYMFFDKTVDNQLSRHYRLEPQLRRGLRLNEFVNYYQPKIDLATGNIAGVEALIRWIHPERGLVPPMDFVPALELTGLIAEAGGQVIQRAIADWWKWRAAGLDAPRIAVNVAAEQLRGNNFVSSLQAALAAVDGNPAALSIEVTESILITNMERAIEILSEVRSLGIPVAIDDFGTGYSSLAYLVTLPIDELKVDRAFIRKITTDPAYYGIVQTCITLAHSLKLKVVAEGVETEEQAQALRDLECDQAQGFLYSKPVSADDLARMLPPLARAPAADRPSELEVVRNLGDPGPGA